EASGTDPLTSTNGNYTFYGRYVSGTAADNREALATTYAARYSAGTDLLIWRDPATAQQTPFDCNQPLPSWYPLKADQVVAFDEQENPTVLSASTPVAPAATNRVHVGGLAPASSGWLYLNLNTTVSGGRFNPIKQAFVTIVRQAASAATVGLG